MPRYPSAVWRPIGAKTYAALRIDPSALITHSDAGFVRSLQGWWLHPASGSLACHLHVDWYGYEEQYVDTARRAAANMAANGFAISTECSNSPDYRDGLVSFDADPFSPEQVASLIRIHRWAVSAHRRLPARRCTDGRSGFGWHGQYPQWTLPGHACPGRRRVEQLIDVIYPAVISGGSSTPEVPDMTPEQDRRQQRIAQYSKTAADQAKAGALYAAGAHRLGEVALSWLAYGGIPQGLEVIYQARLGRAPDAAGLAAWSKAARQFTFEEIDARIAATPEARKRVSA